MCRNTFSLKMEKQCKRYIDTNVQRESIKQANDELSKKAELSKYRLVL